MNHFRGIRVQHITLGASVGFLACSGFLIAGDTAATTPTFTKDVAPIFQEKCDACHRKDSMAPMSLMTYEETRPWAKSIKERVATRQMPPWHLDKTVGIQQFKNDRSLTDEQIATIVRWVDARRAAWAIRRTCRLPSSGPSEDGWQLAKRYGQPDFVIKSADYTMPARGPGSMVEADHRNSR